jgi:lysozyme
MTALNGIDVSNNNGTVDWAAWHGKIAFAGVKISEGLTFADPDAARNMAGARGIGVVRIAYHFLRPALSGSQQATYFLHAKAAGLGPGDLVMADVETTDGLAAAEVSACAGEFATAVRDGIGAWPVSYTTQSFAETGSCTCDGLAMNAGVRPSELQ